MTSLNINLIQTAVKFGDPQANMNCFKMIIEDQISPFSIIVLPELWTCCYDIDNMAEHSRYTKDALKLLSDLAHHKASWIIGGSLPVLENGKLYNRTYVVDDSGMIVGKYDKCHLFPGLDDLFTPGCTPFIFNIKGTTCACVLCYDIRVPEYIRALALSGVEILFVPAAWGKLRISHWRTLLQARGMENEIFVMGVNQCGRSGRNSYGGNSLAVSPFGNILKECRESYEILRLTIDTGDIGKARKILPVFEGRNHFLYQPVITF